MRDPRFNGVVTRRPPDLHNDPLTAGEAAAVIAVWDSLEAAVRFYETHTPVQVSPGPPPHASVEAVADYIERVADGVIDFHVFEAARCLAARCKSVVYTGSVPIQCWVDRAEWYDVLGEFGLWFPPEKPRPQWNAPAKSQFWSQIANCMQARRTFPSIECIHRTFILNIPIPRGGDPRAQPTAAQLYPQARRAGARRLGLI